MSTKTTQDPEDSDYRGSGSSLHSTKVTRLRRPSPTIPSHKISETCLKVRKRVSHFCRKRTKNFWKVRHEGDVCILYFLSWVPLCIPYERLCP